jgi:formylglycine-generating enzyme required for sulfatase activity
MSHDVPGSAGSELPQVFVSYAHEDAEKVARITRLLEAVGVTVWRDIDRLLPGQKWKEKIAVAIKHSRVILLMGSPHSFKSADVRKEVELSQVIGTDCVPIWISAPVVIPDWLGYDLAGVQWVDVHSESPEQWLSRLIKALVDKGVDIKPALGKPNEAKQAPVGRPLNPEPRMESVPQSEPVPRSVNPVGPQQRRAESRRPSREFAGTSRRWLAGGALCVFALLGFVIYKANKKGPEMVAETNVAATRDAPESLTTVAGRIKLRLIPAGSFEMGSYEGVGDPNEHGRHPVHITRAFYLGQNEITQAQYEAVIGENPSCFCSNGDGKDLVAGASTDSYPVERVSWLDAVRFCNRLSEKEGLKLFYLVAGERVTVPNWSGEGYRLPTEAEWEYACDGDPADLDRSAWCKINAGDRTHAVGEMQENRFGLRDMLGNVWEWCWDAYEERYYRRSVSEDPRGPAEAPTRVYRGGAYSHEASHVRAAHRHDSASGYKNDDLGFRVARGQSYR